MSEGIWSGKFNLQAGHWPEVTQLLNAPAHSPVYITETSLRIVYCTLARETGDNKGLNETNFYAPSVTGTRRRTDNHNLPLPHFLKQIKLYGCITAHCGPVHITAH